MRGYPDLGLGSKNPTNPGSCSASSPMVSTLASTLPFHATFRDTQLRNQNSSISHTTTQRHLYTSAFSAVKFPSGAAVVRDEAFQPMKVPFALWPRRLGSTWTRRDKLELSVTPRLHRYIGAVAQSSLLWVVEIPHSHTHQHHTTIYACHCFWCPSCHLMRSNIQSRLVFRDGTSNHAPNLSHSSLRHA